MNELIEEIKELIIKSVDALELGLAVQKSYGLVLDSKTANLKEIFYSVKSLAQYIFENRK